MKQNIYIPIHYSKNDYSILLDSSGNLINEEVIEQNLHKIFSNKTAHHLNTRTVGDYQLYPKVILFPEIEENLSSKTKWVALKKIDKFKDDQGAIICEALSLFWPYIPPHQEFNFNHNFEFDISEYQEITFYGGSFNPFHDGHKECIRQFSKTHPLIIVPDHNPLKQGLTDICFWERFKALKAVIGENQLIYPGFCGLEQANPTWKWVKAVKEKLPNIKINLLMGDDNFESLEKWLSIDILLQNLGEIFIVPRYEKDVSKSLELIKKHNPSMKISKLFNHEYQAISSSAIRSQKA